MRALKKGQSVTVKATGQSGIIMALNRAAHRAPYYMVRDAAGNIIGTFTAEKLAQS